VTRIKAVVFDMDGVLIEAKDWHYAALNRALGLFGFGISRYDHLVTYDGLPTRRKLEMLTREQGLPAMLHDFINELKQLYTMELVYAQCKPRFYHEYALARLKKMGYQTAVASNSIRATVEVMMAKSNLQRYMDVMLSNEDVTQAKPHPDIYLLAAERLGLQADECLVVEDNEHGIHAAQAAGCHLLVVEEVTETNFANIMSRIAQIESGTVVTGVAGL
jgi:HAD superfamily hydrolase (TIGR01509 family)